jgi:hypothetical protein
MQAFSFIAPIPRIRNNNPMPGSNKKIKPDAKPSSKLIAVSRMGLASNVEVLLSLSVALHIPECIAV